MVWKLICNENDKKKNKNNEKKSFFSMSDSEFQMKRLAKKELNEFESSQKKVNVLLGEWINGG